MTHRRRIKVVPPKERTTFRQEVAENIVLIKFVVMLGLVTVIWVPQEYQMVASLSANLLWLWKT